jgi:hypothetical protein
MKTPPITRNITLLLGVATVVLTIITLLPNYTFTIDINMNLPAYSNLQYPSNASIMQVKA